MTPRGFSGIAAYAVLGGRWGAMAGSIYASALFLLGNWSQPWLWPLAVLWGCMFGTVTGGIGGVATGLLGGTVGGRAGWIGGGLIGGLLAAAVWARPWDA